MKLSNDAFSYLADSGQWWCLGCVRSVTSPRLVVKNFLDWFVKKCDVQDSFIGCG